MRVHECLRTLVMLLYVSSAEQATMNAELTTSFHRASQKQPKELLVLEGHVDDIQLIQWCPRIQKDGKRLLVT